MDNLRAVIKNLFCYISPQQILQADDTYQGISEDVFVTLGANYIRKYSNDELRNMFYYMLQEFEWQNRKMGGEERNKKENKINVFDTLLAFNFAVLIEENCEPMCQYVHLLRWREMITALEEDLFITSFLAKRDILRGKQRRHFFWKPVIGHNNYALNRLLSEGVAENHFHLKGSAPTFHLTWINMMNYPEKEEFAGILQGYDQKKLRKNMEYSIDYGACSYVVMWRQAALIRLFLFAFLNGDYLEAPDMACTVEELYGMCSAEAAEKLGRFWAEKSIDEKSQIRFSDYEISLAEELGSKELYKVKQGLGERWVRRLLEEPGKLEEACVDIKRNMDRLRERYDRPEQEYDYALCRKLRVHNPDRGVNEVICGERWFMYAMFTYIYSKDKNIRARYVNWFYAYLVIKAHIRMEIIQVNMNVGFDNFLQYQDRKEQFIEETSLEPIYLKMALRDTIYNQAILSLEARIAPKNTEEELINAIRKYDRWACMGLEEEEERKLKARYFYVVHFIKEKDNGVLDSNDVMHCRHDKKREDVARQALAIAGVRELGSAEADRIRGIDASAPEIVCRPEVFAQAFRYLKNHTPEWKYTDPELQSACLMATYHVGEDFLDVTDGLRAIDEAISFLNLRCGDRLGHALALGVDVDEWYQGKTNRILISKQDYLDNLVWLYSKIRKYNLTDAVDAQSYIEKRFDEYFQDIYIDNIATEEYAKIVSEARNYFDGQGKMHGYIHTNIKLGINEYYNAWKLRGDNPDLYRKGYLRMELCNMDEWEDYAVNRNFPQNYAIRYNPSAAFLYYAYHYNERVRKVGAEMVEIKVLPCIIRAVKAVQKHMQREISNLGIGIETNPSSNYLIGSFRRYDKHPIVSWYNNGLTYDEESLKNCPQIQVSINTDDQGVFATYIENEYAYMALALEKYVNEKGERVYNRTLILQWLDNIRRMGIRMSFGVKRETYDR